MKKIISHNLEETEKIAREWLEEISIKKTSKALIVGLSGHLGAGKTAFVKMVAKALGIVESVTSPTFVIMKNYNINQDKIDGWKMLVHIDFYRLEKPEEIKNLNLEKVIEDPKNLIMIEWPEHVGFKTDLQINFKALDKAGDYEIEFVGRG
jgi:tRNA threonylcarbamoyladenosine biosynthesis protein TsaE